ncbi:NUDIX domain-containing protein [Actinoallomurus sp. NPDC050550]|uniref:NUDIX domain-containing protein n=1 Tax=Actinoallomurus sp. NPDC050550 TaxID=3154937 RepID=UPI0033FFF3DA
MIDLERLVDDARRDGVGKLVVGAVVHDGDRVLILRRSAADDFLPGIEELPSGGVEDGEDLLGALARELAEETGLSSMTGLDPGFVASFDYASGSGRRARQYTFALPYDGGPITLSAEHEACRWISRADLAASDLTEESARTLREFFEHGLSGRGPGSGSR